MIVAYGTNTKSIIQYWDILSETLMDLRVQLSLNAQETVNIVKHYKKTNSFQTKQTQVIQIISKILQMFTYELL